MVFPSESKTIKLKEDIANVYIYIQVYIGTNPHPVRVTNEGL